MFWHFQVRAISELSARVAEYAHSPAEMSVVCNAFPRDMSCDSLVQDLPKPNPYLCVQSSESLDHRDSCLRYRRGSTTTRLFAAIQAFTDPFGSKSTQQRRHLLGSDHRTTFSQLRDIVLFALTLSAASTKQRLRLNVWSRTIDEILSQPDTDDAVVPGQITAPRDSSGAFGPALSQ